MTNKFWDLFEAFMTESEGAERAADFRRKAEAVGVRGCDWKTPSFKRVAAVLGVKHQLGALVKAEAEHADLARKHNQTLGDWLLGVER